MPEQRSHMRNIRPKAAKPLPVVNFAAEAEEMEECPDCGGFGDVDSDCDACEGVGADDEGNPCRSCDATGVVQNDCALCNGSGEVPTA
jgi:hypothetical protein